MTNQNQRKRGWHRNQSGTREMAKQETAVSRMQKNRFFQCHRNGKYD